MVWGLLLLILSAPAAAWGAEFSASMLVKEDAKIMPGKIQVSNGKLRQEFTDERGQTITIVRPDLKVIWVVLPGQGTYMEMPLTARLPGQFIQIPPQASGKRLVGQERQVLELKPGDRVYLCTDGVIEAENSEGQEFGLPRLVDALDRYRNSSLAEGLASVVASAQQWCAPSPFADDLPMLALEISNASG